MNRLYLMFIASSIGNYLEIFRNYLEIFNVLIALFIFTFGLSFFNRLELSLQKKAICFFLLGIILFAITEVLVFGNALWKSEVIELLKDLAKISFIVCFGITLLLLRQSEKYEISGLHRRAFRDILTGFYNYAFFCQSGKQKFLEAKRSKLPLSVMMLDLDNFKAYNDTFGHQAGNVALKCFAQELKQVTRNYDLVARYGGEEFVVLVNADIEETFDLAQRVRHRIAKACTPNSYPRLRREITVSIGIASITDAINDLDELIEVADVELYRAKQAGKNRVYYRSCRTRL